MKADKMRIIVWEKEQKTRQALYTGIDNYIKDGNYRVCFCTNRMKFLMEAEENRLEEPEIFIINIEENALKRIAIAKNLKMNRANTAIIFIAQTTDYFEAAFEAEPVYCMLKPLKLEVLEKALGKALKQIAVEWKPFLVLKGKNIRRIFHEDIYYIESEARKLRLHCVHGTVEHYGKLDEVEENLREEFVRCHKSYLVNMRYIGSMDSRGLILLDGKKIPIKRSKAPVCKERITAFLEGKSII